MNGLEKKLRERQRRLSEPIDIFEDNDTAKYLIGWPGYRISRNKSGLGYVETQAELAHMQSQMLVWLFTGRFITHNPIFLFLFTVFGLITGVIPLLTMLAELFTTGNFEFLAYFMPVLPLVAIGVALFINAMIGFFNRRAKSITGD